MKPTIRKKLFLLGILFFLAIFFLQVNSYRTNLSIKKAAEKEMMRNRQVTVANEIFQSHLNLMLAAMDAIVDRREGSINQERMQIIRENSLKIRSSLTQLARLSDTDYEKKNTENAKIFFSSLDTAIGKNLVSLIEQSAESERNIEKRFEQMDDELDLLGEKITGNLQLIFSSFRERDQSFSKATTTKSRELKLVNQMIIATGNVMLAAMDAIVDKNEGTIRQERKQTMENGLNFISNNLPGLGEMVEKDNENKAYRKIAGTLPILSEKIRISLPGLIEEGQKKLETIHRDFKNMDDKIDGLGNKLGKSLNNIKSSILEEQRQASENVRKTLSRSNRIGLIIFLVTLAFFIPLLLFVGMSILQPINSTLVMLKDISEGQGDLTKRLNVKNNDEIKAMSNYFNDFIDNLHGIISNIAETSSSLTDSSQNLSDVANRMASNVTQMSEQSGYTASTSSHVSENVNNVASSVEQANSSLSGIAAMTEELSVTLDKMAKIADQTAQNVRVVAESNEEISTRTGSIASSIEEMTASLNEVSKNTLKANQVSQNAHNRSNELQTSMESLVGASNQIGKVVQIIKDIADQTNMLALNATIEAASAGEAGKGFAVVAGEVKELARQSADATDEISEHIDRIQSATSKMAGTIGEIGKVIGEVADISNMIASAVEEQTAVAGEISKSIAGNADTVKNVYENSKESSEFVDEIALSVKESSKTSGDIARYVEELSANVKNVSKSSSEAAKGVEEISINIGEISSALQDTSKGAVQTHTASRNLSEMAFKLSVIVKKFKL